METLQKDALSRTMPVITFQSPPGPQMANFYSDAIVCGKMNYAW